MKKIIVLLAICLSECLVAFGQDFADFSQLVEVLQLNTDVKDLSESDDIKLPEPRLAYVNVTGITSFPATKSAIKACWMEVYDGNGNYFKKRANLHLQGNYSKRFPKTNFSCDFSENDWTEDKTPDIRFGNWVKQDGFHFKAFYTDFSRGIGEIGYKMFARLVEDRRPYWERGGYTKDSKARCFPDGFPAIVYLNGKFYGIFAWQLKKHRKNMNMEKHDANHIHLDGSINNNSLFQGRVLWNQFEVRNPKDLYTKLGKEYDGDSPKELMDESSNYYNDSSDDKDVVESKKRSAQVKASILKLSGYDGELYKLVSSRAGTKAIKARFEACFDLESMLDYVVFFYYTANGDGSLKNWQWFTYDGNKWMVTPYDLDQTLGLGLYGQIRPSFFPIETLESGPFYWLNRYYKDEIQERWHQLRQSGMMTSETLVPIANDWCERIGENFYQLERQKWPDSPCYTDAVCNRGWKVSDRWEEYGNTKEFDNTTTYYAGDLAKLEGRLWEATATVRGVKPFIVNGDLDDLPRLQSWISDRIVFMDSYFAYSEQTAIESLSAEEVDEEVVAIYTLSGVRVSKPSHGVFIYKYKNGTSRKVVVK